MKNMIKKASLIVAIVMMISLFAGCGSASSSAPAPAPAPSAAPAASAANPAPSAAPESSATKVDFPKKPIQIICPVKAGGDTDRNARALAAAMTKYLGTSVVVVNVDGGATVMGMQQCIDAEPDGYTLVINGTDMFVPNMMGVSDITIGSFKTIGVPSIDNTTVLAVHKDAGFKDLKDLVEQSIANPNGIEYGGKIGATNQICGVAMNEEWGAKMKFMDVGNNAAKVTALLSRQTNVINISYSVAKDYFVSGEFLALTLLGSEKNNLLADVPMASDFGFKNVDFSKFFWVGTGPNVPDEIVEILADAVEAATKDPEFVANMESNYLTVDFKRTTDAQKYCETFYEETMLPYKEAFLSAQ